MRIRSFFIVGSLTLLPILSVAGGWILALDAADPAARLQDETVAFSSGRWTLIISVIAAAAVASFISGLVYLHIMADRKRAEESLLEIVHRDPLTGLANRQKFRECLDDAVKNA